MLEYVSPSTEVMNGTPLREDGKGRRQKSGRGEDPQGRGEKGGRKSRKEIKATK